MLSSGEISEYDSWDVMHHYSPGSRWWTTTNVGEAAPGVQTPLSFTTWARATGPGVTAAGIAIGVFTATDQYDGEVMVPFFGRSYMSVDFLKLIGERLPGATGEQVVGGFIGRVPPDMTFSPTRRFYLNVLRRYPVSMIRLPGLLQAFAEEQDHWWPEFIARVAASRVEEGHARALLAEALRRQYDATVMQCVGAFAVVQPMHDVLVRLADKLGAGDVSRLTTPVGGAETAVIRDIWDASRGRCSVGDVAARHGFHGPHEGELESHVWREDTRPLERVIAQYGDLDESQSPQRLEAATRQGRTDALADLVAAAPRILQPAVKRLATLAMDRLKLRGVAKRSMLQGFDAVRASARVLGSALTDTQYLDDPDDVFYLTMQELTGPVLADAKELVARRRSRRAEYQLLELPGACAGVPRPIAVSSEPTDRPAMVSGIGVSTGRIEGIARVVTDPAFGEVEPDEILVAPTTDPSWASIMFISAGLVVDIGGPLSHAAVVARELGLPCVVNTRNGTSVIRTGDRVRLDGDAGTVEILP